MRRFPIFLIVFSVLAAAAGFFIRGAELRSAFDPISGLAIPGAGATGLLIALTAAVAAAAAAAGIMISARFELPNDVGGDVPEGTQSPEGTALSDGTAPEVAADAGGEPGASVVPAPPPMRLPEFLLALLGCIIWFAGSAGGFIASGAAPVAGGYAQLAFFALSAVSACGAAFVAHAAFTGRSGGFYRLLSIVPPIFYSYWMILLYRDHASDPVIVNYGYECLAVAAAAMCFYFLAGCLFGKHEPGKTLFCAVMTIFLCGAVSADSAFALYEKMIILSAPLISLANIPPLVRRLVRRVKRPA